MADTINTDTLWTTNHSITGDLTVTNNATLTIQGTNSETTPVINVSGSSENDGHGIVINSGSKVLFKNAVPHNSSKLVFSINGGTLEFNNSLTEIVASKANSLVATNQPIRIYAQSGGELLISGGVIGGRVSGKDYGWLTFWMSQGSWIRVQGGTFINGAGNSQSVSYTGSGTGDNYSSLDITSNGKVILGSGKRMEVAELTGDTTAQIIVNNENNNGMLIGKGITDSSTVSTYDGVLNCSNYRAQITKTGAGTQVLTGDITRAVLECQQGTLAIGKAGENIVLKGGSNEGRLYTTSTGTVRIDGNVELRDNFAIGGTFTGSGTLTATSGNVRFISDYSGVGITLDGATLQNDDAGGSFTTESTVNAPINVVSDSSITADWGGKLYLKGKLTGSSNLTVTTCNNNGWVDFAGDASEYSGNITLRGQALLGATGTDVSDSKNYLGSGKITFAGGRLLNYNNNSTVTNDIELVSATIMNAGYNKNMTYTGNLSGSGNITLTSDSGTINFGTTVLDDKPYTGSIQINYDSTSSYAKVKLTKSNAFGTQVGLLTLFGSLDMNGCSQQFAGLSANTTTGILSNSGSTQSVLTLNPSKNSSNTYSGTIQGNTKLVLDGEGTQILSNGSNSFTGDIVLNSGKLSATAAESSNKTKSALGNLSVTRTITINSGATLSLGTGNVFGGNGNYAQISIDVDGGTFSNDCSYCNKVYNLTLRNGSTLYIANGDSSWKGFILFSNANDNSDVFIKKSETRDSYDPVTISSSGLANAALAPRNANFIVDDITNPSTTGTADNLSDLIISAVLSNHSTGIGNLTKSGTGTMELTAKNDYTGTTTINAGVLKLSGNGTLGTGKTTIYKGAMLEFNVESGQTRKFAVGDTEEGYDYFNNISTSGTSTETESQIVKSGNGDLKILLQSSGQISVDKLLVSSGRLDIKSATLAPDGYVVLESNIDVLKDATFSPGNSIGILKLATGKDLTIETGGKLLVEINADDMDKIDGTITYKEGSILELVTIDGYTPSLGGDITETLFTNIPGIETALKKDPSTGKSTTTFSSYYYQVNYNADGTVSSIGVNPNAVPEPSTWALLVLGFAGLMWLRRKRERR